jgi:hypothetical protein
VIHSAQFEISIDGVPRTYRDQKELALLAAQILKFQKSPQCGQAERLADRGRDRHRVQGGATITECSRCRSDRSPDWLKFNNP